MLPYYKKTIGLFLILIASTYLNGSYAAEHLAQATGPIPGEELQLGKVSMQTGTASPEARAHFLLGLKYLHNFMYSFALREFDLAQELDPTFVLSYWGKAMSYKHPLWSYEDKAKGLSVLKHYQALKGPYFKETALEKDLMSAVTLLYGPSASVEDEKKYLEAMGRIYQQHPQDPDLASFYALSMLGYAGDVSSTRDSGFYLERARLILQPFIKKTPAHPGIIHYYMHAMDLPDPRYLKAGLTVVPKVYKYMEDSSHVLHMPSHLYTMLGQWPEGAQANERSIKAGHRVCQFLQDSQKKNRQWTPKEQAACDASNIYHSMEWLHYEYLQMGHYQKAAQLLKEIEEVVRTENQQPRYLFWYDRMQARQSLYTGLEEAVAELPVPIAEKNQELAWASYSECGLLLADGLSAIKHRQLDLLPKIEQRYQAITSLLATTETAAGFRQACLLDQQEVLAAKFYYVDHQLPKALAALDQALGYQQQLQASKQSLTLPILPAQELYGELALQLGQKKILSKAASLYENEQGYNPNRAAALLGMARVQLALGNKKSASSWYGKLKQQYQEADSLPILKEINDHV